MEHVRACWGYAKWVYIATMLFYTGKFGWPIDGGLAYGLTERPS
jgi:hypothetical protein